LTATPAAAQAERETPLLARARAAAGERHLQALAALTLLGGALRFATLGRQSFWFDETTSARLIRMPLGSMLRTIPHIEATPPLYYVVAWLWARAFGFDEAGIRSLSALAGTVTVPVVYLAARQVATRRVGLVAAALTATSPLMLWYSQEARAYAFLALFSALSFLLFVRALDVTSRGRVVAWAAVCVLALASHYFAVFVVMPEAALLLRRASRRVVVPALAGIAVVGVPLLALAIRQRSLGYTRWISALPFGTRLKQAAQQFVVGDLQGSSLRHLWYVGGAIVVLGGAALLMRARGSERRGALLALGCGAGALAVPMLLAAAGLDYVVSRNLIGAWPLLAIGFACGLGARRAGTAGLALTALAAVLFLGAYAIVERDPSLQRDDWRAVAAALGMSPVKRALLTDPFPQSIALGWYRPDMRVFPDQRSISVRELDVVGRKADAPLLRPRLFGLGRVSLVRRQHFVVARYRADLPRRLVRSRLEGLLQGPQAAPWAVLLDPSRG
jgi:mannosyltransferase